MDELYLIMRDFLEIEYNQKSLLYLLEMAEEAHGGEDWLVTNGAKYYLKSLQEELRGAISRLDQYMAERAGKQ